jgi:cell division protein FtsL
MTIKNNIPRKIMPPKKAGLHWIVIICIIFCELLAYTWVRTESTQTILQISTLQKTLTEKGAYQKALSVERNRLKSDERITRIAKTRLNLSTVTMNQTIYFPAQDTQGKKY